jgi:hypothetical protein
MFVFRPIGIILLRVPEKRIKIGVIYGLKSDGTIGWNR